MHSLRKRGRFVSKGALARGQAIQRVNNARLGRVTFDQAMDLLDSDEECGSDSQAQGQDVTLSNPTNQPPVSEVEHKPATIEGSRIIDVTLVAGQLDTGCVVCGKPLSLGDIDSEKRSGIANVWKIMCRNCGGFTSVHTSKRHRQKNADNKRKWAYNLNTKATVGMIHAGIGQTHVNAFLTSMDVPPVSFNMIRRRSSEAGPAIEKVAQESCKAAVEEERQSELAKTQATDDGQEVNLAVSYDMGWQKTRGFNSLTGTGHVMGPNTGSVLGYETRNKRCTQCDRSRRLQRTPPEHDCRKNYSGSSKAMEGNVAVSLFKKASATNNKYKTLIGDDDSTTIAWLREEVDSEVEKYSDINHSKRALHGQLAAIKGKHKELTVKVIDYSKKCFMYAVTQNANNADGLKQALNSIPLHMFGDHTTCSMSWCGFLQRLGPNLPNAQPYRHTVLKNGENLKSADLQRDLTRVFGNFAANAHKLAPQGSSQRNESLNNTIISKTTKTRYYGGTAQNDYRVGAAVAQKNLSYTYVPSVMEELDVSPGKFTSLHAERMCRSRERHQARKRTPGFKRRRLINKCERAGKNAATEVCEGVAYDSGLGFREEAADITQIPKTEFRPKPDPVDITLPHQIIIFDVETANSGSNVELTQIAASTLSKNTFSQYILPSVNISKHIQDITGLSVERRSGQRVLCLKTPTGQSTVVPSVTAMEALQLFLAWLDSIMRDQGNKLLLVAHNCQAFDMRHLLRQISTCDLMDCFTNIVSGFGDTLPYFREAYKGTITSFKLSALHKAHFDETYDEHNAIADVEALCKMFEHCTDSHPTVDFKPYSLTLPSAVAIVGWTDRMNERLVTFTHLFAGKERVISKAMAQKISGSGLAYCHLKCVFSRNGAEGIAVLLSAKSDGKVRVTARKDIIRVICDHFEKAK